MDAGQLRRLQLRQFAAVLHKNLLLQTRARKSILGIGGWGALLLQLLTPVAFFSLMCIPKYYIQPYVHPMYLETQEYQVDTKWWAGASPYEGAGPGAYPAHACRLHHDPATFSCRYCRQIWSWGCAQRMHRILAVSSTATSSPWGHALAAAGVAVHSLAALHHPLPPPPSPTLSSPPHRLPTLPGPAYARNGSALVFLSPDTPAVRQLANRLAQALACPDQPYKRICSQASITTFACLWGVQGAPSVCLVRLPCS